MHEMNEWEGKGYARAIAICTKAESHTEYPTQDKHSLQDETDYIRGFNIGMKDFKEGVGVNTCAAYAEEKMMFG